MKKAMVIGLGTSGSGAKRLLDKMGYETILVDDEKAISSKDAMEFLDEVEFAVKSPGFPYNFLIEKIIEKNIKLIDEIELSYNYMEEQKKKFKIIAVTGTNGKTTTTDKITGLLKFSGYKALSGGNIGTTFADILLENADLDFVVLELSSFQLENLKRFKADISMVINLTEDHLSRYENLNHYFDTKFNICKNMNEKDYFICNIDDKEILKRISKVNSNIINVSKSKETDLCVVGNDMLYKDKNKKENKYEKILDVDKLSLKGEHNLENNLFIVATAKVLGISNELIREYLYNTLPLEHRLERFFKSGNIQFINDSKGTNIDSSAFALKTYKDSILICGGYDKEVDYSVFAEFIVKYAKAVYLIGDIADKLESFLLERNYDKDKINKLYDLDKVIKVLKDKFDNNSENNKKDIKILNSDETHNELKKETVLFSPGTSSYDQFTSYINRGEYFKEKVLEIFGDNL